MIFQNIRRILKWGTVGFVRNGTVSFSSVLVMVIALLMIGSTMLITAFLDTTLEEIQDKIDINVYFSTDAQEEDIFALQRDLERVSEVESVKYISKEQAYAEFQERHQDDELTLQALEELDENPLRARFNIKAKDSSKYDAIANTLESDGLVSAESGSQLIDKVNYRDNKLVIDRMNQLITYAQVTGFWLTVVLVGISVLITFNTIRLAIYISKEEIGVMRLVGADRAYIRGPFIVEGMLYGIVAGVIALGLFYPITLVIKRKTEGLYGGLDLFQYYISNFTEIFGVIMLSGIALGAVSSFLAVRKYLRE